MDESRRSNEEIRQDIAREEENLSRTAQQIGDRIKEQLDWSEYVKDSPYWALGIAGGIGFFASRLLQTHTTSMERIIGSLAEEVRGSLGGSHVGAARPSLAQLALLGIGTKLAADWIRKANSSGSSCCDSPPSQTIGKVIRLRKPPQSRKAPASAPGLRRSKTLSLTRSMMLRNL